MGDGLTLTAGLLGSPGEKVALVRVADGRPEILTVLPADTIGSGEPLAPDPVAYWTVPTSTDSRAGDLLVWREVAWQLTDRCGPQDGVWCEYADWAVAFAQEIGLDPVVTVARNEVWAARMLSASEIVGLTAPPTAACGAIAASWSRASDDGS